MRFGQSHCDLRARKHGPQPLRRGGVNERSGNEPARKVGAWGVAAGRIALAWGSNSSSKLDCTPYLRPKCHPLLPPSSVGGPRSARTAPTCARQTAKLMGVQGRGLVGGAKAGSREQESALVAWW